MLALQYHPIIAWVLGMPRVKQNTHVGDYEWSQQFPSETMDRIQYGYSRMEYLCGTKKEVLLPGGQFAYGMMNLDKERNYLRDLSDPCLAIKYTNGKQAAIDFIDKVWPTGESRITNP